MTCCFSVITEHDVWSKYISKADEYDFYHTWEYHHLDQTGEPILFVYEEHDVFIACPFIKRKIEHTEWFDLTSVYGYSGPFSNQKISTIPNEIQLNFAQNFKDFLSTENYVSVFARLHPFLNQVELLSNLGGLIQNGKTIYIDLSTSLADQRNAYHKRLWRQIKQLKNKNYVIKLSKESHEINRFGKMYQENMDRLSANPAYYFDQKYFYDLCHSNEIDCKLLAIYDESEMICAAIIGVSNSVIRNHLSATHVDYTKESPSKLLTDEISLIGRKINLKYFHLGGGLGGKFDSLFDFKAYFSPLLLDDFIWCYIANEEIYQQLNLQYNPLNLNKKFPSYRVI